MYWLLQRPCFSPCVSDFDRPTLSNQAAEIIMRLVVEGKREQDKRRPSYQELEGLVGNIL